MQKNCRGFALLSRVKRREIASRAGRTAHRRGTAHEWTSEEAREAGRKGGGILLRSGESATTSRVDAMATALDDIATTLQEAIDQRCVATARAILTMRLAIDKATDAINRIEQRTNS